MNVIRASPRGPRHRLITSSSSHHLTPSRTHMQPFQRLLQTSTQVTTLNPTTPPPTISPRRAQLASAKPFSDFLTDTFNRRHDYLRISVTERCNLRCLYCMPEAGVPLSPPPSLLTTPEILMIASLFVSQGTTKIRLTGGEPTVRRDVIPLMQKLGKLRSHGLRELCLTTNGLTLHRKLDALVDAGLTAVNLSLDTLDPHQFTIMTRRNGFDSVKRSINRILEMNRAGGNIRLKINCVVMRGLNDGEILPFVELTRDNDLEVRFIEYMPFDGNRWAEKKMFSYADMLDVIRSRYPDVTPEQGRATDTSKTWRVPGHQGKLGFITSMTSDFCGGCNRLRITSDGNLKVCLFGNAEVSLRDVLRKANGGQPIDEEAYERIKAAENERWSGGDGGETGKELGIAVNEEELLRVIGQAVKGKKAKHAGIGELEHMKNRPMILIDRPAPTLGLSSLPSSTSRALPGIFLGPLRTTPPSIRLFSTTHYTRTKDSPSDDTSVPPSSTSTLSTHPSTNLPALSSNPIPIPTLTHVSTSGTAHMVPISHKTPTSRQAIAVCHVQFSSDIGPQLIVANATKKGDVLGTARIAGIMAAKRTSDLIPLCHPLMLSKVAVELEVREETRKVEIKATVGCEGKTGVEMEAMVAAGTAAMTVYDMCKAVDRAMIVEGLRVVLKEGGKSGRWEMP